MNPCCMRLMVCCCAVLLNACGTVPDPLAVDDVVLMDAIRAQHQQALTETPPSSEPQPIMLVHGMAGFRPMTDYLEYFYRVRFTVTQDGHVIYAAQTDPFQTVDYRARQLAVQVDEILQLTGGSKVHLVAHSQGGLDARYLISSLGYGDRIASLTTIGTPHHGVRLVDMALRLTPAWVERLASIINAVSDGLLGGNADLLAQLRDLTHAQVTTCFNPDNPDDPRVEYFSYAGSTQGSPFVDRHRINVVNPLLYPSYKLTYRIEGDNDGLVSEDSARWGTFLGTYPADHWDEIGQPPKWVHGSFDHLRFYRQLSAFLVRSPIPPQY